MKKEKAKAKKKQNTKGYDSYWYRQVHTRTEEVRASC